MSAKSAVLGSPVLLGSLFLIILVAVMVIPIEAETSTGMANHTGNDPNYVETPGVPPNPAECFKIWQGYIDRKKASQAVLTCCASQENCACIKNACGKNPTDSQCAGASHAPCLADCGEGANRVNITLEECVKLPQASGTGSFWNWLWILILIAVIVIILIIVAICCVYWKKFGGKGDSKADRRKGHIGVGPMNVSSKVHWSGKHKGSHHKGSHHKGGHGEKHSMRRGTSKGGKRGGSMKQSTSMNSRPSRRVSTKQSAASRR